MKLSLREEVVHATTKRYGISIRFVGVVMGISKSSYYYHPKPSDRNTQIADWLLRLIAIYRQ